MELLRRRRWTTASAQVVSCCGDGIPKFLMQHLNSNIQFISGQSDSSANPILHLLLLKSSKGVLMQGCKRVALCAQFSVTYEWIRIIFCFVRLYLFFSASHLFETFSTVDNFSSKMDRDNVYLSKSFSPIAFSTLPSASVSSTPSWA